MNEALQRIPADAQQIRSAASAMFEQWEAVLPKFGHRDDYWKRVIDLAGQFADRHGDYGRLLMAGRMEALETEWRMLHPTPAGNALKEVVDGQVWLETHR